MMLPEERVIAALEHCPFDRVPVREIGVDYAITDRALGYETLYRAKWREYQAYWQGRRDEIVESYKRDIVALARKFEWDVVPAPLVPPRRSNYEQAEFLDEFRWRTADGSEWIYSPLSEGHAIRVKFPEVTTENIPQPQPVDESELEVAGTSDEVSEEVQYVIQHAGQQGGLVLTSSNTLMVGVKYENYLAMRQAARENRRPVKWKLAPAFNTIHNIKPGTLPENLVAMVETIAELNAN